MFAVDTAELVQANLSITERSLLRQDRLTPAVHFNMWPVTKNKGKGKTKASQNLLDLLFNSDDMQTAANKEKQTNSPFPHKYLGGTENKDRSW